MTEPAAAPTGGPHRTGGRLHLRRILIGVDALAVALAWAVALCVPDGLDGAGLSRLPNTLLAVTLGVGISLVALASQRLYRARECAIRASETVKLGRTSILVALALQAAERRIGVRISLSEAVAGATLGFLAQRGLRDAYRSWLTVQRRQGRHSRPLVLVGANQEGLDLYHLIGDHPELGYRICGVVGDPAEVVARDYEVPFLGEMRGASAGSQLVEAVRAAGANGVLMAASALDSVELNRMVRDLIGAGLHVHLSSGLRGIDARRVRSQPLAHEPLFYLEPAALAWWQVKIKRILDVSLAGMGLVVGAPVLGACALAIKLHDHGPVFFRQERVGREGQPFTILKFRSMVTDAEARLAALMSQNQRDGALFKLSKDPRITPIGRFLRATSLDELPQLINVVRGEMSLVGPRPALASEVALFDEVLLARQRVLPGITGLWQVEARDSASFRAYQRLDLFYVENWSVGLDLAILLGTVQSVIGRAVGLLRPRKPSDAALTLG